MTITLGNTTDDKRVMTKSFTNQTQYTGYLKADTSILRPQIEISTTANITGFNYAFIPEFSRYYYITDIVSTNEGFWLVSMAVDVLKSWDTPLRNVPVIAEKNTNMVNYYLNDADIPCNAYNNVATFLFSEGATFRDNDQLPYILVCAGKDWTV